MQSQDGAAKTTSPRRNEALDSFDRRYRQVVDLAEAMWNAAGHPALVEKLRSETRERAAEDDSPTEDPTPAVPVPTEPAPILGIPMPRA